MKTWIYATFMLALTVASAYAGEIADSAQETKPLGVDDSIPAATLRAIDGSEVDLGRLVSDQKSAIVFYRGGWCPFCTRHLAEIQKVQQDILAAGYQMLAISPDSPESLRASMDKGKLSYRLLSDSSMAASRAFGLAFRLDEQTKMRQKKFGFDLLAASGGGNEDSLPVPAFYLVSTNGEITFAHTDPNYMKRISADDIIAALESSSNAELSQGLRQKNASVNPMTVGETPRVSAYGDSLFFAGQPSAESFALFAEMGVKNVINIRSEGETAGLDFDERAVVTEAGMRYVNIDACKEGARIEMTEAVMDELDKAPGEMTLIHCASSNRVGYVWSVYRGVRHGLSADEAIAEGKKAGLRSPVLEERARKYMADVAAKS